MSRLKPETPGILNTRAPCRYIRALFGSCDRSWLRDHQELRSSELNSTPTCDPSRHRTVQECIWLSPTNRSQKLRGRIQPESMCNCAPASDISRTMHGASDSFPVTMILAGM